MPSARSYTPRVVDAELTDRLRTAGAIVIEGPRACGKTETARQVAASEVLLDVDANAVTAVEVAPAVVLDGATPRLIDEWQVSPAVWNHVRRAVDARRRPGQFILTGSAVPSDDVTRHTGAGRMARLRMRPMSLFESGHATGAISLRRLLRGQSKAVADPGMTVPDVIERIVVGGWPALCHLSVPSAQRAMRDYLDEVRRADLARVVVGRRDPDRVAKLLASLGRTVATPALLSTLGADAGGADGALADETVRGYLDALGRLMIVEDQPAWSPKLRSRSRLRTAVKRHFVDPALAVAALRATPDRLLKDLEWTGFLFESLVVRDLRVLSQAQGAEVAHYRDNTGLEVDAIVSAPDGTWAAFEVKLGQSRIEEAAGNLLTFASRIETRAVGPPAALGVIVASGAGYRRRDGVAVIPIGALGP